MTAALLDATVVKIWLREALAVAQESRALVDSLNVFPVPDADTGTNVTLTLSSAHDALQTVPVDSDIVMTTRTIADGALRGARGNSGLLFSQALSALADVVAGAPSARGLRPVDLVRAYEKIADTSWAAVSRPVPGTLLTVASDAAASARQSLEQASARYPVTIGDICAAAALGAQESVVETAGLGHGPVDAGGAALMLLYTALSDVVYAMNEPDSQDTAAVTSSARPTVGAPDAAGMSSRDTASWVVGYSLQQGPYTPVALTMLRDLASGGPHAVQSLTGQEASSPGTSSGEFEVMYLLQATATQAQDLRRQLEAIGDCVGVVGTPDALGVGLYQVHVHTDTPRAALPRAGSARQICIHNLHPTTMALAGRWDTSDAPLPYLAQAGLADNVVSFERRALHRPASPAVTQPAVGVIACTRAPGLIEQLARTGAVVVLDPHRDGIVRAVGDLNLPQVLILPCDAEAASAAHDAARHIAARALASDVRIPTTAVATNRGIKEERPPASQLLVADTNSEAGVLAATVELAARLALPHSSAALEGSGERLMELARAASLASASLRTCAFCGAQAEPEVLSRAITDQLRPDDSLITVIVGRDALPDAGSMILSAVADYAEATHGESEAIDVVIHLGSQSEPDVLVAIE